jgi:methyl-accepting chemotaxis protein
MKIRVKLFIIPVVGSLFYLVLFATVSLGFGEQRRSQEVYAKRFVGYTACTDVYGTLLDLHAGLYRMIAWCSSGYDASKIQQLAEREKALLDSIEAALTKASADTEQDEERNGLYTKAATQFNGYREWALKVIEIVDTDQSIASMFMGTAEDMASALQASLVELKAIERRLSDEAYAAALHSSDFTLNLIIATLFAAITISIAIAIILSRQIIRSLDNLHARVRDISQGSGDLSMLIEVNSSDEIGGLGHTLNEFITRMEGIVSGVKRVTGQSKDISGSLSRIAVDTSADTEQMSASLHSSRQNIEKLNHEIQSSAQQIKEIASHIGDMTNSIENQSSAVAQSSSAIEEIVTSIRTITTMMEAKKELSERLTQIAMEGLSRMEESTQAIAKVTHTADEAMTQIKVINGINANLNLLAMNAAIEAAHAGSAGSGFAVVAGEVRRLAEETGRNSKSISGSLASTVSDMQTASRVNQVAKDSFKALMSGITDIVGAMEETRAGMNELSVGSTEIVRAVSSLMNITSDIRERSSVINDNASSIEATMGRVAGLSTVASGGMGEVAGAVLHVSESMARLADVSHSNEENVERIDQEMRQFRTRDP